MKEVSTSLLTSFLLLMVPYLVLGWWWCGDKSGCDCWELRQLCKFGVHHRGPGQNDWFHHKLDFWLVWPCWALIPITCFSSPPIFLLSKRGIRRMLQYSLIKSSSMHWLKPIKNSQVLEVIPSLRWCHHLLAILIIQYLGHQHTNI
jgi:hypothetical protein